MARLTLTRSDLGDLNLFRTIARAGGFRRAALELDVSGSALSHAMRGLETRLGVRLANRTNRSVTLTEAGQKLLASLETGLRGYRERDREPQPSSGYTVRSSADQCPHRRSSACFRPEPRKIHVGLPGGEA
ncbi:MULTISPECIES: LysR family transcriptional regulator [unclassified Bradyrhizobium]